MAEKLFICGNVYKTKGWLVRHFQKKQHAPIFSIFINRDIIKEMKTDIGEIKNILEGGIMTNNMNKSTKTKDNIMNFRPIREQKTIPIENSTMSECINILSDIFKKGMNTLEVMKKQGLMIDVKVIQKTDEELEFIIMQNNRRKEIKGIKLKCL